MIVSGAKAISHQCNKTGAQVSSIWAKTDIDTKLRKDDPLSWGNTELSRLRNSVSVYKRVVQNNCEVMPHGPNMFVDKTGAVWNGKPWFLPDHELL